MGVDMAFPRFFALILALFAVVGVFIEIPFVSNYAFWIMTAAYVIQISSSTIVVDMAFFRFFSLVLALFAVVGVFIEIPFVSNYAFWIMTAAYVIQISSSTVVKI
jgi:hypothetical protein